MLQSGGMRLLYLTGTWPNPSESFLAREVAALRQAGWAVEVVALRAGQSPDPAAHYRGPSTAGRASAAWAAALAPASPRLLARWLRNLPLAAWLADHGRARGADLVHAAWAGLPLQVAWMAWRLGGLPYTAAAHAHDVFAPPEASPAAFRAARGVVACNRAATQALWRRLPGLTVAWLPHGLPLAEWPWRAAEPEVEPFVLGVGRLVPKKGFDTLVRAAGQAGVRLRLLGDGPERARLEALASQLGVRLEIPGWQPETAVREALGEATALALPSRVDGAGDRDGVANVLLEALAVGVPLVTTAAGSARDVIVPEQTGLLVPPDDPPALAAALTRLLADRALRARLTRAGRRAVERRFDTAHNGAAMARWLAAAAGLDGLATKEQVCRTSR